MDIHAEQQADQKSFSVSCISCVQDMITSVFYACVSMCVCVRTQCGEEERSLRQYWYTSWPDQKTPDKAPPLLELVQEVERAREEALPSTGPIIVHCR